MKNSKFRRSGLVFGLVASLSFSTVVVSAEDAEDRAGGFLGKIFHSAADVVGVAGTIGTGFVDLASFVVEIPTRVVREGFDVVGEVPVVGEIVGGIPSEALGGVIAIAEGTRGYSEIARNEFFLEDGDKLGIFDRRDMRPDETSGSVLSTALAGSELKSIGDGRDSSPFLISQIVDSIGDALYLDGDSGQEVAAVTPTQTGTGGAVGRPGSNQGLGRPGGSERAPAGRIEESPATGGSSGSGSETGSVDRPAASGAAAISDREWNPHGLAQLPADFFSGRINAPLDGIASLEDIDLEAVAGSIEQSKRPCEIKYKGQTIKGDCVPRMVQVAGRADRIPVYCVMAPKGYTDGSGARKNFACFAMTDRQIAEIEGERQEPARAQAPTAPAPSAATGTAVSSATQDRMDELSADIRSIEAKLASTTDSSAKAELQRMLAQKRQALARLQAGSAATAAATTPAARPPAARPSGLTATATPSSRVIRGNSSLRGGVYPINLSAQEVARRTKNGALRVGDCPAELGARQGSQCVFDRDYDSANRTWYDKGVCTKENAANGGTNLTCGLISALGTPAPAPTVTSTATATATAPTAPAAPSATTAAAPVAAPTAPAAAPTPAASSSRVPEGYRAIQVTPELAAKLREYAEEREALQTLIDIHREGFFRGTSISANLTASNAIWGDGIYSALLSNHKTGERTETVIIDEDVAEIIARIHGLQDRIQNSRGTAARNRNRAVAQQRAALSAAIEGANGNLVLIEQSDSAASRTEEVLMDPAVHTELMNYVRSRSAFDTLKEGKGPLYRGFSRLDRFAAWVRGKGQGNVLTVGDRTQVSPSDDNLASVRMTPEAAASYQRFLEADEAYRARKESATANSASRNPEVANLMRARNNARKNFIDALLESPESVSLDAVARAPSPVRVPAAPIAVTTPAPTAPATVPTPTPAAPTPVAPIEARVSEVASAPTSAPVSASANPVETPPAVTRTEPARTSGAARPAADAQLELANVNWPDLNSSQIRYLQDNYDEYVIRGSMENLRAREKSGQFAEVDCQLANGSVVDGKCVADLRNNGLCHTLLTEAPGGPAFGFTLQCTTGVKKAPSASAASAPAVAAAPAPVALSSRVESALERVIRADYELSLARSRAGGSNRDRAIATRGSRKEYKQALAKLAAELSTFTSRNVDLSSIDATMSDERRSELRSLLNRIAEMNDGASLNRSSVAARTSQIRRLVTELFDGNTEIAPQAPVALSSAPVVAEADSDPTTGPSDLDEARLRNLGLLD